MSSVQEKKCILKHTLDEEGYLVIKPSNTGTNMLETTDALKGLVNDDVESLSEIPSNYCNDDAKEKITQMCTTASTTKGVDVFRENEIEEAKGMEKKS